MKELKGRGAIVTGGGSGIGYAIAQSLVASGVNVIIASRRKGVLESAAATLNALRGGKATPVVCDVRRTADIVSLVSTARAVTPTLDILVNNSGLGVGSKIVDCTDAEWDLVLDTNLKGAFLLTRAVLPHMIAQKSGYIINIASQAALHGYANAGPYCASKYGLLGFSEALQAEVREFGIMVHTLCPALVQVPPPATEADVNDGVLQTEDLASTVMFLLTQPGRIKYDSIGLYRF